MTVVAVIFLRRDLKAMSAESEPFQVAAKKPPLPTLATLTTLASVIQLKLITCTAFSDYFLSRRPLTVRGVGASA